MAGAGGLGLGLRFMRGSALSPAALAVRPLDVGPDGTAWAGTVDPPPSVLAQVPNVRFLMEEPVALEPAGPILVENGVWSGSLFVGNAGTNIFLRANDTAGHIASGNEFAVLLAAGWYAASLRLEVRT